MDTYVEFADEKEKLDPKVVWVYFVDESMKGEITTKEWVYVLEGNEEPPPGYGKRKKKWERGNPATGWRPCSASLVSVPVTYWRKRRTA